MSSAPDVATRASVVATFTASAVVPTPPLAPTNAKIWHATTAFARNCGAHGVRVTDAAQLDATLAEAVAHDGPAMVEVITDPDLV